MHTTNYFILKGISCCTIMCRSLFCYLMQIVGPEILRQITPVSFDTCSFWCTTVNVSQNDNNYSISHLVTPLAWGTSLTWFSMFRLAIPTDGWCGELKHMIQTLDTPNQRQRNIKQYISSRIVGHNFKFKCSLRNLITSILMYNNSLFDVCNTKKSPEKKPYIYGHVGAFWGNCHWCP